MTFSLTSLWYHIFYTPTFEHHSRLLLGFPNYSWWHSCSHAVLHVLVNTVSQCSLLTPILLPFSIICFLSSHAAVWATRELLDQQFSDARLSYKLKFLRNASLGLLMANGHTENSFSVWLCQNFVASWPLSTVVWPAGPGPVIVPLYWAQWGHQVLCPVPGPSIKKELWGVVANP